MKIETLKVLYFSPTGTTEKIVTAIANGINVFNTEMIDITQSESRQEIIPSLSRNDFVILGSPVYEGRLPYEVERYFKKLIAYKTPAVAVVVYGGRAYEDALKELYDIISSVGFKPVAASAFIGEHSFSSQKVPIVHGRPDMMDVEKALQFGIAIRQKLDKINNIDTIETLNIPGNINYRKRFVDKLKIGPTTDTNLCSNCGICINICPTEAIIKSKKIETIKSKCLLCCACIKKCPSNARTNKNILVGFYSKILKIECRKRKEAEIFL